MKCLFLVLLVLAFAILPKNVSAQTADIQEFKIYVNDTVKQSVAEFDDDEKLSATSKVKLTNTSTTTLKFKSVMSIWKPLPGSDELIHNSVMITLAPGASQTIDHLKINWTDGAGPHGNLDDYQARINITAWDPAEPFAITPVESSTKAWKDTGN